MGEALRSWNCSKPLLPSAFCPLPSDARHPHHFLEARRALGQLAQSALPERPHAAFDGHVLDLEEVLGTVDEVADGVVDGEDLADTGAAEVAGVAAADAARPFLHDDALARRGLEVEHRRLLHGERSVALSVFADLAPHPRG